MNKYKSFYTDEIVTAEMAAIREILKSDAQAEIKVSMIVSLMGFVDGLVNDEEVQG